MVCSKGTYYFSLSFFTHTEDKLIATFCFLGPSLYTLLHLHFFKPHLYMTSVSDFAKYYFRWLGMPLTMKQLAVALSALALLMWLALMYGAFLGASLCGNPKSVQRGCTTCGFSFGLIPGIISQRNGHPVY